MKYVMLLAAVSVLLAGCKQDGCGNDNDCKGDRICEAGRCVSPNTSSSPASNEPKVPGPTTTQESSAKNATPPSSAPKQATFPRLGSNTPLVTLIEFGDFQCKYCAQSTKVLKQVIETYGKKSQDLAFEWHHNPLDRHPRSLEMAYAAAAAHEQGRFWQFHDQLFATQRTLGNKPLDEIAKQIGLDIPRWKQDSNSRTLKLKVLNDRKRAVAMKATGTPTFFINGRPVSGLQSFDNLKKIIDEEIVKAKAALTKGTQRQMVATLLTRKNNPEFAKFMMDGVSPPEVKSKRKAIDKTVWNVPVNNNEPTLGGGETALVTLVEFADFECPFCNKFRGTLAQLLKVHGSKIRLVFKHNPLSFHKNASIAAQAAVEAHAQGKFWEYHDRLFSHQNKLDQANLIEHAKAVGLDSQKLRDALAKGLHAKRVTLDQDLAAKVEAIGTPNLFINGRRVVGARAFEDLNQAVLEEIERAKKRLASGIKPKELYANIIATGRSRTQLTGQSASFELDQRPVKGPKSAPINMVVFVDFQSPFSSRLVPILGRVEKAFSGKVRTTIKHFPEPHHKDAVRAAEYAYCADRQERFWDMHAVLFNYENQKQLDEKSLKRYASDAGLDANKLEHCLASGKARKLVMADLAEGKKLGVKGTPTVFLNGKRFTSPTGYNDRSFTRVFTEIVAASSD